MKNIIKITEERIMSLKADVKILEERKAKIDEDISLVNFEIKEMESELNSLICLVERNSTFFGHEVKDGTHLPRLKSSL